MTSFDRRQFLSLNAAALAGAALAPAASASPGFYRFVLGDVEITVLSDGHFHFPMEFVAADIDPIELPDAEVVISEAELEFWTGDEAAPALEPRLAVEPVLAPARGVLGALADRLRTARGEEEVAPGIRSIPSPGHTPGHICVGVEAGGEQLLLTGDAIVFTHASFEHPEWELWTDLEREKAGRTRTRLLDRAAADEMLILGFHFPFPGLGYALEYGDLEYGDAYRWHPAGWNVLS